MITLDEAVGKINEAVHPLPPRFIPPLEAVGCALAEEIVADADIPGFASSAMDGIAVRWADLNTKFPIELSVQGVIPAGKPAPEPLRPESAFRIMTGAALPRGADTVIKVEDVSFKGETVVIREKPRRGDHVRPVGNDIRRGERIFPRGYALKKVDAGVLATLGRSVVRVHPHPRIAVLVTGSELKPPGQVLKPGEIHNANETALRALITSLGLPDPGAVSPVPDDREKLTTLLDELCRMHDLVITSGAVSMGEFDFIPGVVDDLGGKLLFHKVFVKPGKPALVAAMEKGWLLGLPGNPVSVLVTFHLYGKRMIARLEGKPGDPHREKAVTTKPFHIRGERFQVWGARLRRNGETLQAEPVDNYTSGRLSSVKGIDGFIMTPGGTRTVEAGTQVEVEWI